MKTHLTIFLLLLGCQPIFAQYWYQKQAITPSIECDQCQTGYSVVVNATQAFTNDLFSFDGAVSVYQKDPLGRWNSSQIIYASDAEPFMGFGYAIAQSGTDLFVGAIYNRLDDNGGNSVGDSGAAYIFEQAPNRLWQQSQKIVPSERGQSFYFGHAIATNGGCLAVSANWNTVINLTGDSIERAGAVYFFEKDTSGLWTETQSVRLPNPMRQDEFGDAIAMSETQLFVGAPHRIRLGTNADTLAQEGAVYVYEKDSTGTWIEKQQLRPLTLTQGDGFGQAISHDGQTLMIGAPESAEVHVFQQDSAGFWQEVQILQVIDSATPQAESFGSSMEVNGGYALIGAPQIDRYGACWMFKKVGGNWQQWYKITPNYQPVPTSGEGFGHSVSFNGWHLLIGIPFRNAMIPNPNNTLYSGQVGGLFFYEFTINALSL
ncbi:MAG: hypothetical protein AAFP02_12470, partial [Bacteroidota bacterium]